MNPDTNGSHVTRAELRANLDPMRDDIREIRQDVNAIREALGAGPRWLGARMNAVIDKILPAIIAGGALWLLADKLSGN